VTAAPAAGFAASSGLPPEKVSHRRVALDTGALQADAFTVDQAGSLAAYDALAVDRREELLAAETAWLRAWGADLVAADAVPLACAAAELVGIPSVVVSNFSWDFIFVSGNGSGRFSLVGPSKTDYSSNTAHPPNRSSRAPRAPNRSASTSPPRARTAVRSSGASPPTTRPPRGSSASRAPSRCPPSARSSTSRSWCAWRAGLPP
jgi:L-arabinokinase